MSKRKSKKKRFPHVVCKPCWELRYCPYGPLIELFPADPDQTNPEEIKSEFQKLLGLIGTEMFKTEKEITKMATSVLYLQPTFWEKLSPYDTTELECSVFGHICPVFIMAEPFTETKEMRRIGRYIPREIMLKVVRRDGQICQTCGRNVPDNQIEFDHIIPISRGGPVSVENLRVLCRDCNRKKNDTLDELINDDGD